ncbi:hypothetical protein V22_39600 [Calycomorphotria hydatis]|uniref:Uncharacterized protein n=1 Tax=Calycomorphotria hydatis TaxID=2528027 RepID=A0A517TE86_9PLAN|nr:hypothetical protein V22_39600 [Calycomorphotria hydatis]
MQAIFIAAEAARSGLWSVGLTDSVQRSFATSGVVVVVFPFKPHVIFQQLPGNVAVRKTSV